VRLAESIVEAGKSSIVDKNSFFWKMTDGRMPPPPCAKTLGLEFVEIDGERGTIETRFEAVEILLNPARQLQGGFLAAMLDDTMGTHCRRRSTSASSRRRLI